MSPPLEYGYVISLEMSAAMQAATSERMMQSQGWSVCLWVQMQTAEGRAGVPLALVGSGLGGDCAPSAANFRYIAVYAPPYCTLHCTPHCTPHCTRFCTSLCVHPCTPLETPVYPPLYAPLYV